MNAGGQGNCHGFTGFEVCSGIKCNEAPGYVIAAGNLAGEGAVYVEGIFSDGGWVYIIVELYGNVGGFSYVQSIATGVCGVAPSENAKTGNGIAMANKEKAINTENKILDSRRAE
jgi:hypothetical protein